MYTDSITENLNLLKSVAIISELDHDELCSLPDETIKTIDSRLSNNLRTVLLIHDKRFFGVPNNAHIVDEELPYETRSHAAVFLPLHRLFSVDFSGR